MSTEHIRLTTGEDESTGGWFLNGGFSSLRPDKMALDFSKRMEAATNQLPRSLFLSLRSTKILHRIRGKTERRKRAGATHVGIQALLFFLTSYPSFKARCFSLSLPTCINSSLLLLTPSLAHFSLSLSTPDRQHMLRI